MVSMESRVLLSTIRGDVFSTVGDSMSNDADRLYVREVFL